MDILLNSSTSSFRSSITALSGDAAKINVFFPRTVKNRSHRLPAGNALRVLTARSSTCRQSNRAAAPATKNRSGTTVTPSESTINRLRSATLLVAVQKMNPQIAKTNSAAQRLPNVSSAGLANACRTTRNRRSINSEPNNPSPTRLLDGGNVNWIGLLILPNVKDEPRL